MTEAQARIRDEAEAWLKALGNDPDAVAASLGRMGCKGKRGKACSCPIAAGLRALEEGSSWIANHYVVFRTEWTSEPEAKADVPPACRAFMVAFDSGKYPELCSEESA